jgi:hypothetical protein
MIRPRARDRVVPEMAYTRRVRTVPSLLLVLSLLWQASGFAHAGVPPCPMEEQGPHAPMASERAPCCDELPPGTGDPCQSWLACPLLQSLTLLPLLMVPAFEPAPGIESVPPPLHARPQPATIWRPPSLS